MGNTRPPRPPGTRSTTKRKTRAGTGFAPNLATGQLGAERQRPPGAVPTALHVVRRGPGWGTIVALLLAVLVLAAAGGFFLHPMLVGDVDGAGARTHLLAAREAQGPGAASMARRDMEAFVRRYPVWEAAMAGEIARLRAIEEGKLNSGAEEVRLLLAQSSRAQTAIEANAATNAIRLFLAGHPDWEEAFAGVLTQLNLLTSGEVLAGRNAADQEAQRLLVEAGRASGPNSARQCREDIAVFLRSTPSWETAMQPILARLRELEASGEDATAIDNLHRDVQSALNSANVVQMRQTLRRVDRYVGAHPLQEHRFSTDIANLDAAIRQREFEEREDSRADTLLAYVQTRMDSNDWRVIAGALALCERFQSEVPRLRNRFDGVIAQLRQRLDMLVASDRTGVAIDQLEQQARTALESGDLGAVTLAIEVVERFLESPGNERYAGRLSPLLTRLRQRRIDLEEASHLERLQTLKNSVADLFTRDVREIASYERVLEEVRAFCRDVPSLAHRLANEEAQIESRIAELRADAWTQAAIQDLRERIRAALQSDDLRETRDAIARIQQFARNNPAQARLFDGELRQLRTHESLLNQRADWQRRTQGLQEQVATAMRDDAPIMQLQTVLRSLEQYIAALQSQTDEVALACQLQLRESRERLTARFDSRRRKTFIIDAPAAGTSTADRVCEVNGRTSGRDITSAILSVNGRELIIPVANQYFHAEVILIAGNNTIRVSSNTEPYIGEYERTIRCTAPPTELWAQLSWDEPEADLDLYVTEPGGATVFWRNQTGGGVLDRDQVELSRSDDGRFGPEHYYISAAEGHRRYRGDYIFRVHYYRGSRPVNWRLLIYINDTEYSVHEGTLTQSDPQAALIANYRENAPSWTHVTTIPMPNPPRRGD